MSAVYHGARFAAASRATVELFITKQRVSGATRAVFQLGCAHRDAGARSASSRRANDVMSCAIARIATTAKLPHVSTFSRSSRASMGTVDRSRLALGSAPRIVCAAPQTQVRLERHIRRSVRSVTHALRLPGVHAKWKSHGELRAGKPLGPKLHEQPNSTRVRVTITGIDVSIENSPVAEERNRCHRVDPVWSSRATTNELVERPQHVKHLMHPLTPPWRKPGSA
jgi:hypothetical protein